MKLDNRMLRNPPADVTVPTYDRTTLEPGIVHIGLGNFHRAHQAWYLHRLMQQGLARDWAVIGAGVRAYDARMRETLLAQDCLTALIELGPAGRSAEIIGPMIDYLPIEDDNASLIRMMSDPRIRIVSLTVTEGGYYLDAEGRLEAGHPDILHDAADPGRPVTAFGAMIAALARRRAAGHPPFTAQSCDNLQGNGDVLRQVVVSLARLSDPDLADWIESHGAFPNSMVDCIVPATGPDERRLAAGMGIADAAPVTHENFRQWVIEDRFCAGRPDWDRVGATFTGDVHVYEAMKIRILNAGHQVLANPGELLSLPTIAACMQDPLLAAYFRKVQTEDILPHVAPAPGISPADYLARIERRFANPAIRDTTRRVAFDGSSRHAGFILPTLRLALETGASTGGLALVEALWARMCTGLREDGTTIAPNDPHWPTLHHTATHAPSQWLKHAQIYGDLEKNQNLNRQVNRWLDMMLEQGVRQTLEYYLAH